MTKEFQLLWKRLHAKEGFELHNTLFVDDSLPILESAQLYGIQHLLGVKNPDSKKAENVVTQFPAISNYDVLLSDIKAHPILKI